ncbi:MAG: arginyltransferase [Candidatus Nitronauta litoralis]|uniref:Arginyltransferase n=1 Tax=Candidatus Nitronauta litoralis TaxID=2705533 RepID=A0A7T0G0X7_9BACT|nr:MAG: arginyltransferase [Candidatus Nitronauta litoralis]
MLAHFIDSKPFQCGYFNDRYSVFEEYLLEDLSEVEFEYLLVHGMRHFGEYFFRPNCGACHACVPIRVRTYDYKINRSQKRAVAACKDVQIRIGAPRFTPEKFDLYLAHKTRFKSLQDDVEDLQNFKLSFYGKGSFGVEFEYYLDGKLIGAALGDVTRKTFSCIYTFYQPDLEKLPIGTFSVVKQIEYSLGRGIPYTYLGYYIAQNQSLSYKANFRPSELYIDHEWRPFRNAAGDFLVPEDKIAWKNTDTLVKATSRRSI